MVSKKKINGWAAVALVFLVCAVVYGLLSSYPRELAVYSDELRYLDVARSLLQGRADGQFRLLVHSAEWTRSHSHLSRQKKDSSAGRKYGFA